MPIDISRLMKLLVILFYILNFTDVICFIIDERRCFADTEEVPTTYVVAART